MNPELFGHTSSILFVRRDSLRESDDPLPRSILRSILSGARVIGLYHWMVTQEGGKRECKAKGKQDSY